MAKKRIQSKLVAIKNIAIKINGNQKDCNQNQLQSKRYIKDILLKVPTSKNEYSVIDILFIGTTCRFISYLLEHSVD